MDILFSKPLYLIALTSFFYVVATLAMKQAAITGGLLAFAVLALCLAAAALCEILVFRQTAMGGAYLTIIAVETLLVLGFATLIGDGLNGRETIGAVLVLAGAGVLST